MKIKLGVEESVPREGARKEIGIINTKEVEGKY